jgi:nucleotide-binding universal stress UspA family protein
MSTIVVGVDGSPTSDAAVAKAIELAGGLGDALVVVYAVEPPYRGIGDEWSESQKALEELGRGVVDAAVESASQAGVVAEAVLVPKRPAEALIAMAEAHHARLIVVGTASERPITGVILGSVPHKLLHRSSVPVLVVPLHEGD